MASSIPCCTAASWDIEADVESIPAPLNVWEPARGGHRRGRALATHRERVARSSNEIASRHGVACSPTRTTSRSERRVRGASEARHATCTSHARAALSRSRGRGGRQVAGALRAHPLGEQAAISATKSEGTSGASSAEDHLRRHQNRRPQVANAPPHLAGHRDQSTAPLARPRQGRAR